MQKVERKQHRGPGGRKALWIAVIALGAVLLAVFLPQLLYREPPAPPTEEKGGSLVNREWAEVSSVTVARRDHPSWTVIRGEDGSLRPAGESWMVDSLLGDKILDAAANIVYEAVLTEDPDEYLSHKADFGLEPPLLTAEIRYTDESSLRLTVGSSFPWEERTAYYALIEGDSRMFALPSGLVEDLNTDPGLFHPVSQPVILPALLDRITIADAEGKITREWYLRGNVTDQDAGVRWMVSGPKDYPADEEIMNNLKTSAGNLRLGMWAASAAEESLRACGFDPGEGSLTFHMAAGSTGTVSASGVYDVQEWPEQEVRLLLGGPAGEHTRYVAWNGEIYSINNFSLEVFTQQEWLSCIARYLVLTPLNSLDSLTVESFDSGSAEPSETVVYRISRESGEGTGTEEDEPLVRCSRNGEELNWDTFSAAYERLLTVTVSGRLPENWEKSETQKKYTFRSVSGGTHTLEFSVFDAMHDAVTLDGCTVFYLIRGGMTQLP